MRISDWSSDVCSSDLAEIKLAAEIVFPTWLLLKCFERFAEERPDTRVQLFETVLGGTDEALLERKVDFAIAGHVPGGFFGESLMRLRFVAVSHPDHPLQQLGDRKSVVEGQSVEER